MTGPADRIRLVVVGCGRVFERFHLPALERLRNAEVVAVVDPNPARLAWARGRMPGAVAAGSPDQLPQSLPFDAALVLTPPPTHVPLGEELLERAAHILVEKPMAPDLASGAALVATAERLGRRVQVGFTRRFRAPYRALGARLRAVSAPAIHHIVFDLAFPTGSWGAHSAFLGDESQGGGVLDDVLSHQVDLLRWLLDSRPARVRVPRAEGGRASIEIEFRSGVRAHCTSAHATYVEVLQVGLANGRTLVAGGTSLRESRRGRSATRRLQATLRDRAALAWGRVSGVPGVTHESFFQQLEDFTGAVRGRPSEGADARDGLTAIATAAACRESLRSGQWCSVG